MGRPKKQVSEEKIEKFQRELELAGGDVEQLLNDKRGRSRSCLLCRRRKQRCDHKLPSCTACLKAAVKCVQPARYSYAAAVAAASAAASSQIGSGNTSGTHSRAGSVSMSPSGTPSFNHGLTFPLPEPDAVVPRPGLQGSGVPNAILGVMPTAGGPNYSDYRGNFYVNHKFDDRQLSGRKRKLRTGDNDYTKLLEKKLKYLENLIELPTGGEKYKNKLGQYKKITHLLGHIDDLENLPEASLIPNTGESHTDSVRNAINNSRNDQNESLPPHQSSLNSTNLCNSQYLVYQNLTNLAVKDILDQRKCLFSKYKLWDFLEYDPLFEFDQQLSYFFLDTFFRRLQFKYPLLDEQEIYSFHGNFIKNRIQSYTDTEFHFACGRMWLVFAISACLNMTTGKYKGHMPGRYFSTAVYHLSNCGTNLNYVQQVELLVLLILYVIRTDRDTAILYDIIKDVMHICKDKLHLNTWRVNDPFANKKLRLFWCVYLLERMICVAVGRPYTIAEAEIDLPLFDSDSFNTKGSLAGEPKSDPVKSINTNSNTHSKGVHFINQSLKLRRIESQYVERLKILPSQKDNKSKDFLKKQLHIVKKVFQDLEVWRASCSQADVRNFENETLKLYYYRSVRLLIQPYLEVLRPENRLFRECQAAAGQICQLYKIFHQKTITGHSTPAVHTVFVAGVTLIYCMWLARNYDDEKRRKLGDDSKHTRPLVSASLFSTMDDLRACSVCLYVMTERSKFATIFRDTFDQLMNATMGNLIERCGPDSAELIYMVKDKKVKPKKEKSKKISGIDSEQNRIDSGNKDSIPKMNHTKTTSVSSDSLSASSNCEGDGMPPAVNRIFGKRQAEEHVGFVENSQVDLAEQAKFKKKQGVLEKISVPKSLSHLLIKMDEEEEDDETEARAGQAHEERQKINLTSSVNEIRQRESFAQNQHLDSRGNASTPAHSHTTSKAAGERDGPNVDPMQLNGGRSNQSQHDQSDNVSTSTSNTTPSNKGNESDEYVVKKLINFTEFDWKAFEQQAFVQQHMAQQNLQTYLTYLNNKDIEHDNSGLVNPISGSSSMGVNGENINIKPNPSMAKSSANGDSPRTSNFATIPNNPVIFQPTFMNEVAMPLGNPGGTVSLANLSHAGTPPTMFNAGFQNSVASGKSTPFSAKLSSDMVWSASGTKNNIIGKHIGGGHFDGKKYGDTANGAEVMSEGNKSQSDVLDLNFIGSTDVAPAGNNILLSSGTHDMINNISTWTNDSVSELMNNHPGVLFETLGPVETQRATKNDLSETGESRMDKSTQPQSGAYSMSVRYDVGGSDVPSVMNDGQAGKTEPGDMRHFWTVNDDYGFLT